MAAILVMAGVALTVFPQGDASNGPCLGPGKCQFAISGEILVGSDYGSGMIILTVANNAGFPFSNITLTDTSPSVTGLVGFTPFTFDGRVISAQHALQIGTNSTGYYTFTSGGKNATAYTLTLEVMMTNGQLITEKANIVSDG